MQQWHVVDMEFINNKPLRHVVYTNVARNPKMKVRVKFQRSAYEMA